MTPSTSSARVDVDSGAAVAGSAAAAVVGPESTMRHEHAHVRCVNTSSRQQRDGDHDHVHVVTEQPRDCVFGPGMCPGTAAGVGCVRARVRLQRSMSLAREKPPWCKASPPAPLAQTDHTAAAHSSSSGTFSAMRVLGWGLCSTLSAAGATRGRVRGVQRTVNLSAAASAKPSTRVLGAASTAERHRLVQLTVQWRAAGHQAHAGRQDKLSPASSVSTSCFAHAQETSESLAVRSGSMSTQCVLVF